MEDAIRRHGTAVYRLAYAYMRSPHDADDVFQDVFLRYAEKAPAFRDDEHQRAWLLRVIHLSCHEGLDTQEIATLLGVKPVSVRSQLSRARTMLEELLKEGDAHA